jgi:hypothetical protein
MYLSFERSSMTDSQFHSQLTVRIHAAAIAVGRIDELLDAPMTDEDWSGIGISSEDFWECMDLINTMQDLVRRFPA